MTDDLAIRSFQPSDLDALYDICLRTGSAGEDASDLVDDPRLFGEIYAAPYAHLEPEHAFVLAPRAGVPVGYVLGALDTAAFDARCEAEWWPPLRARHPEEPGGTRLDDLLVHLIHHRTAPDPEILATHPSHLHIDLLPQVQAQGWGRRLLEAELDALRHDGSAGVHWGVSTRNERAISFYQHLGCQELAANDLSRTFGVRL
jgi:ribosomal protein S18 acetylase RimI-like enzyme